MYTGINEHLKNIRKVYLSVLSSILSMETVVEKLVMRRV
jgi:hypothetical protein